MNGNALSALDLELVKDHLKPSTRRGIQIVFRAVLREAVEAGVLGCMPKLPRFPKVGRKAVLVPEAITRPVAKAVQGFLELLKDGAYWTYSDDTILARAKEQGLQVEALSDLAEQPLESLEEMYLVRKQARFDSGGSEPA